MVAAPLEAENHAYAGNAHFRLGELDAAELAFARAVELDPNAARYRSSLGVFDTTFPIKDFLRVPTHSSTGRVAL